MIDGLRTQLPTAGELRATKLAFGQRSLPETWQQVDRRRGVTPDEGLLEVVADPFTSVSDVLARLERAEAYLRCQSDRRAVFLTVYTEMTASVEAGIELGRFDDPDWVCEYLVAFADRYREALVDFERGNPSDVPQAWRLGFQASTSDYTLLIQDAVLGSTHTPTTIWRSRFGTSRPTRTVPRNAATMTGSTTSSVGWSTSSSALWPTSTAPKGTPISTRCSGRSTRSSRSWGDGGTVVGVAERGSAHRHGAGSRPTVRRLAGKRRRHRGRLLRSRTEHRPFGTVGAPSDRAGRSADRSVPRWVQTTG